MSGLVYYHGFWLLVWSGLLPGPCIALPASLCMASGLASRGRFELVRRSNFNLSRDRNLASFLQWNTISLSVTRLRSSRSSPRMRRRCRSCAELLTRSGRRETTAQLSDLYYQFRLHLPDHAYFNVGPLGKVWPIMVSRKWSCRTLQEFMPKNPGQPALCS